MFSVGQTFTAGASSGDGAMAGSSSEDPATEAEIADDPGLIGTKSITIRRGLSQVGGRVSGFTGKFSGREGIRRSASDEASFAAARDAIRPSRAREATNTTPTLMTAM